jgi:hypothetical protein
MISGLVPKIVAIFILSLINILLDELIILMKILGEMI